MNVFEIHATPVPAARPRVFRNGGVAYPKKHYDYKSYLERTLPELATVSLEGTVGVNMTFVMPPYKSSDWPTSRADLDNLAKLPMDAMTKCGFWADDSLVVSLKLTKRFPREGEEPKTIVQIFKEDS